jgi:PAS domain S-box-containing protein
MGTLDSDRGLEIARSIFREASDAFFVFDPRDGTVVDVNPAGLRMSGFERREVLALRIQDLFTAEGDGLHRLIDALQKTQYFHSREGYALTRKSGELVAINLSVSRIHTRPESLGLVVARDVSELRRAREGLEQFFRHSPALFAILGKDGRIRTTNPAWEESLGYDPDQLIGRLFADLIHPEDRAGALAAAGRRPDAKPVLFEARFLRADGVSVWLSWCAGTIGGVTYAVALDTTTRKEAEELRSAKRAAETASEAKNRLLGNVSHELRTPLSAMLGLIDVLLEHALAQGDPAMTADLRAIRRNGTDLARLIDDLLDLARAEAGRLEVIRAPCRPAEVVADVFDLLAPSAARKGLVLTSEYGQTVPDLVRTDALRLQQILVNLVGNAIKYTDRGRITVRVESAPPGPAGSLLRFDVTDTGNGLSAEALDGLFQPFHRGGTGPYGAGLGLAISRKLAELLGGTIEVQSVAGRGSTFSLQIDPKAEEDRAAASPLPRATSAPAVDGSRPRIPGRVLLAEDHADNRRAISMRLGLAGLDVTAVGDGQQAVSAALAATANGRPFDVILMDMHMPVIDGFEATSQLRAAGYRGTIIALTADARSEDRSECLRCGCDEHLSKPVNWDQLLGLISTFAADDRPEATRIP